MPTLAPDFPIATERLLLRPLEDADAVAVHAYASRPEVYRYIPFEFHTVDEVREFIGRRREQTQLTDDNRALGVAGVRRHDGVLVGDFVLIWQSKQNGTAEVGWVLDPRHQGRGYATEAARALIDLAFSSDLGIHRVVARMDARNEPSQAVARRLGMRQEALFVEAEVFKGERISETVFAVLRSEWPTPTPTPSHPSS